MRGPKPRQLSMSSLWVRLGQNGVWLEFDRAYMPSVLSTAAEHSGAVLPRRHHCCHVTHWTHATTWNYKSKLNAKSYEYFKRMLWHKSINGVKANRGWQSIAGSLSIAHSVYFWFVSGKAWFECFRVTVPIRCYIFYFSTLREGCFKLSNTIMTNRT